VDDLARFCCHNQECRNHGQRGAGNLSICMRYGKYQHLRLLYCGSCKARFSERQGTPLFGAKLEMGKMVSVLDHISEGCGVRKTSRLTGVHCDTVIRDSLLAGEQAQDLHDVLVAFSPQTREVQFDEKWAFVGKKPHSSWVATRRGLTKPVSSSPPFKTGLAAFTAPGLTPSVLLRGQTAPRSVPSHFSSSTGVHPWTACAFAGYLCSSLSEG
jgi:hypothetical protein